ncbi:hypothetical protein F4678DRAFT_437486 [Xylaria arbuscula]|nr:hypothetical protein F4678DRAFT_437486 [Xylaria arbuscula]
MIDSAFYFDLLLEDLLLKPGIDDQLESLRSHIRRTQNSSSLNSFSRDHPNTETTGWPWNLEPIRQAFLFWAEKTREERKFKWRDVQRWINEDSCKLRFLRWRDAHTPLWPKSWARNWPPLKKKLIIENCCMTLKLGCQPL